MAQLHGSLTPAHAYGCGAQCFEGVQRASIFDLPVCRRLQTATPALRPGVGRSLMGGRGAPAVWLDTEQNVSVCLILHRRPPAGLSFSKSMELHCRTIGARKGSETCPNGFRPTIPGSPSRCCGSASFQA